MHPDLVPSNQYPRSWYASTVDTTESYAPLQDAYAAEVCIVGAGLAGLSVGLELVRRGATVAIVEAGRVAWGASGRNGGFVTPGFATDVDTFTGQLGKEHVMRLFQYSDLGVETIRSNIALFSADSMMGNGKLSLSRHPAETQMRDEVATLNNAHGQRVEYWSRDRIAGVLNTGRYHDGIFKPRGFHIHPLRYALDMAAEFVRRGGRLYEGSKAIAIEPAARASRGRVVRTGQGSVIAETLVVCTSGYDQDFYRPVSGSVLPVATHVAVTGPLQAEHATLVDTTACIADTRNAGDYYRMIDEGRLLWGGKISTLKAPPGALDDVMRAAMADVYPSLAQVQIDYSWSGLMGYCRHKMPVIREQQPGIWVATAFGGHGLNTTAMAGELVATAIVEGDERYRDFAPFALSWGGGLFGQVAVQLSYWWMQAGDRLAEARAA